MEDLGECKKRPQEWFIRFKRSPRCGCRNLLTSYLCVSPCSILAIASFFWIFAVLSLCIFQRQEIQFLFQTVAPTHTVTSFYTSYFQFATVGFLSYAQKQVFSYFIQQNALICLVVTSVSHNQTLRRELLITKA